MLALSYSLGVSEANYRENHASSQLAFQSFMKDAIELQSHSPKKKRKLSPAQKAIVEGPEFSGDVCVADLRFALKRSDDVIYTQDCPQVIPLPPVDIPIRVWASFSKESVRMPKTINGVESVPESHCRLELLGPATTSIDASQKLKLTVTCRKTLPFAGDNDSASLDGYNSNTILHDVSRLPASSESIPHTQCTLCKQDDGAVVMRIRILWKDNPTPINLPRGSRSVINYVYSKFILRNLNISFPTGAPVMEKRKMVTNPKETWKPQDFYENVHKPDPDIDISMFSKVAGMIPSLYRFQKRAVLWMLEREGVRLTDEGFVSPHAQETKSLPPSFTQLDGLDERPVYASHLLGHVTHNDDLRWVAKTQNLKGGILSEEMGLGKTVETISLICLHRRTQETSLSSDAVIDSNLRLSSATLVITPSNLLQQWESELAYHAPHLKVFHYKGVRQSKKREHRASKDIEELTDTLTQHDVVLTTFTTLTSEFNYANEKPLRNMRQEKKYEPVTSPLIKIQWWRVCIDEAQMLGTGLSNAAAVAVRIPRRNAWTISGTPVRKDIDDLSSILVFLGFAPFYVSYIWQRMLECHKDVFMEIFGQIAMRHTKQQVKEDLDLPPQRRVVITLPFSTIEEERYDRLFQEMCDECGLDREGGPLSEWFDPNDERTIQAMRNWLHRLRQTCLHPQVGTRNRQALGCAGPLRSIDEVLEVMIRQNEHEVRSEQRNFILQQLTQGQIYLIGKKSERALEVFRATLQVASTIVSEVREEYEKEKEKIKAEKLANAEDEIESSDDEVQDESFDEKRSKSANLLRSRLRLFLETQHTCVFFVATACYQIKSDPALTEEGSDRYQEWEKEEAQFYEEAKSIRKELLSEISLRVKGLVSKAEKTSAQLPTIEMFQNYGGIESRRLIEAVEDLRELLNAQKVELNAIREKLAKMLSAKLIDQEDDLEMTGEEYEESTKLQDEQYVYLFMFKVAIADRHALITGQINELVKHEVQETKILAQEEQGHAPELQKSMIDARTRFTLDSKEPVSIRSLLSKIRSAVSTVRSRGERNAESIILEREFENLRQISKAQIEAHNSLSKEYDLYRLTMNARLEFYRQLQVISDSVKPLKEEPTEEVDLKWLQDTQARTKIHSDRLESLKTKTRFLVHLRATEESKGEDSRLCVICQSTFETGVLTKCGHQFCKGCILLWWREHRNCPVCKTRLSKNGFHNISYKSSELSIREQESSAPNQSPTAQAKHDGGPSIYSSISPSTLEEIRNIDLKGSYGTKIDTLARHLIWIRHNDPGSKSIIFSQFGDFLDVLGRAFQQFQIGFTSISRGDGITKFRDDTSVECFLLHAKAHSSGLTLVNATHVFLCEPLVNTAIELQAIARVHRIGQTRPTTVWMYLIRDTVEEGIYEMSAARRLDMVRQKSKHSNDAARSRAETPVANQPLDENALDVTESLELQSKPLSNLLTKGKDGGESVSDDDLWSCLFTKRRNVGDSHVGTANGTDDNAEREVGRHLRAQAVEDRVGSGRGGDAP